MSLRTLIETVGKSLHDHPIAITLLALNLMFLAANAWTMNKLADNAKARDAGLQAVLKNCIEDAQRNQRNRL